MSQGGLLDLVGAFPNVPIFFVTDSGPATASLNILNILGGANVTTTGSGNTITIDVNGTGSFTQGSVIFAGPGGAFFEDNAKFFWDDTNFRLGIGGAIVPTNTLTVQGGSYLN